MWHASNDRDVDMPLNLNGPLKTALAAILLCSAAAQADAAPPDRRSVTVSGEGEVSAAPDRARLAMAVEVTDMDLKAAQTKVNGIVRTYLAPSVRACAR